MGDALNEIEYEGKQMNTKVISGFPAVGKSHFYNKTKKESLENENDVPLVSDSDSSNFSWLKDKEGNNTRERNPKFPQNYIEHIKSKIKERVDYVFVSSHKEVRDALVEAGIKFTLVYPDLSLRDEWIERCRRRGSPQGFLDMLKNKWNTFILECETQKGCNTVCLKENEYLSDVIEAIK